MELGTLCFKTKTIFKPSLSPGVRALRSRNPVIAQLPASWPVEVHMDVAFITFQQPVFFFFPTPVRVAGPTEPSSVSPREVTLNLFSGTVPFEYPVKAMSRILH